MDQDTILSTASTFIRAPRGSACSIANFTISKSPITTPLITNSKAGTKLSRILACCITFLLFLHLAENLSGQSPIEEKENDQLSQDLKDLLSAMEGRHPEMSRRDAIEKFKQMASFPDELVRVLIKNVNSNDNRSRIPPRALLKRVSFDLDRAKLLFESLGRRAGYYDSHSLIARGDLARWTDWVLQPGDQAIPLFQEELKGKDNGWIRRRLALNALGKIDKLPNDALSDLEKVMFNPGAPYGIPWADAAMILARQGPFWQQRLVDLLESENEWARTRAAGALEITFPSRFEKANELLLKTAVSDSAAFREAFNFLGQTGANNGLPILRAGLKKATAFHALNQLFSKPENKEQILRECLPVLKEWILDDESRAAAIRGYQILGRNNLIAMQDLADVLQNADKKFARQITNLISQYGEEAGIKAVVPLLLTHKSHDNVLGILKRSKFDAGPISPMILHALIGLENEQRKLEAPFGYRGNLIRLLYGASSFPEEAVVKLVELDQSSTIYRGHVINWLRKTKGERAKSLSEKLTRWNRQAVVADFSGKIDSSEHPLTKKRVKRAAFSPNGKFLAIIDKDQLSIQETSTGKRIRTINLPSDVNQWFEPEFNGTGSLVAAKYFDSRFCLWDVASGKLLASSNQDGLRFLSNPKQLLRLVKGVNTTTLQLLNASNLSTPIREFAIEKTYPEVEERGGRIAIHWSSGAYQSNRKLFLETFELESGKRLHSTSFSRYRDFESRKYWMSKPRLSPSGKLTMHFYGGLRSNSGAFLEIRSTQNLELAAELNLTKYQATIAIPQFSNNEQTMYFSSSDGKLHQWDFRQNAKPRVRSIGTFGNIRLLDNDRWILYTGSNAVLVDSENPRPPKSFSIGKSISKVTVLADGKYFEVATPERVQLFDSSLLGKYFSSWK